MLSFDFSDKQIRVVKGDLVGGKIRIAGAMVIDVPNGVIINGFIQELSKLVTIVSERLRDNRFYDKEAVISLSSSQIVFRELKVPKAKGNQLYSMVKNQMQSDMGVTDDYNITYTVVGEVKEDNKVVSKILAAACPNDIIIGIKRMFNMLSLPLKSISINCNCISRIVLSDPRNKERMPLLAVQIDDHFLNLNLYENNQLAFSRVVPIDKEDYGNSEDYVYEALNENVFKMIQFNRARGGSGIKDVIFYGNVSDYIKLTRAIEQQDVRTHILAVPNQIIGYEKFEFALYANAIGAMLKGKKETEKTNLLAVEGSIGREKISGGGFYKSLIASFVLTAAVVASVFLVFDYMNKDIIKKTDEINEEINSKKVQNQLTQLSQNEIYLQELQDYINGVEVANKAIDSQKIFTQKVFNTIHEKTEGRATIIFIDYKEEKLYVTMRTNEKSTPADVIESLYDSKVFDAVVYDGLQKKTPDNNYEFCAVIVLKAGESLGDE